MFNNSTGNLTKARAQAQGNANWFKAPFAIYTDTSGNVRVCRLSIAPKHAQVEIVNPEDPPGRPDDSSISG